MRWPSYRYAVTTFDPRATWWCGAIGEWVERKFDAFGPWRYSTHRQFRTLKQAMTHAAVLLLRGILDVIVLEHGRQRREWWLAVKDPEEGCSAERALKWARAYLARPRRKR